MFSFNSLSSADQQALRRIHHVTSAATALRILRSSYIWSRDSDNFANFCLNQNPKDQLDEVREVSLSFEYTGPIQLVSAVNPPQTFISNVLYIFVTRWPSRPTIEELEVWAARLPPKSANHLICDKAAYFRDFNESAQTSSRCQLMQQEIDMRTKSKPVISVANDLEHQSSIAGSFPEPEYGVCELVNSWLKIRIAHLKRKKCVQAD